MSSETKSQGSSAWWVGWVKCDYPWCLCQAELLPTSHCCSRTHTLLWGCFMHCAINSNPHEGWEGKGCLKAGKGIEWPLSHKKEKKKASRNKRWLTLTNAKFVFPASVTECPYGTGCLWWAGYTLHRERGLTATSDSREMTEVVLSLV